jgi:hypothetical protein
VLELSNDLELVHDFSPPPTIHFDDDMSWDPERPEDTTETQTSKEISMPAQEWFPDVETVSNQRCQDAASGTQQQFTVASRAPSSDDLDKMKGKEEIGNSMDEATPALDAMTPKLTTHCSCASPPRSCAALNDSDSDSDTGDLQGHLLNSASPSLSSSATTPSLASSQSDLSTEHSKRTSNKRRASAAVYGSDHESKRRSAKDVRSLRPPSQPSDNEACAATMTRCGTDRLTSPGRGEFNAMVAGGALAITNATLHTVLTVVVRNANNILEVSGSQAIQAFLMEMLGDVEELKDVTYEALGEGTALVTAIARLAAGPGAQSTTKPDRRSATCVQQPPKIMEPFTNSSDVTSSSDSEMDAALPSTNAGRKRRRTLQGKSTAKNARPRRGAVCESSDTKSCESQREKSIKQRVAAGRRRRRLSLRPQGWKSGEVRGDPTHSESDSSTDNDVAANEAEVTVRRQSRRPWKASEEDYLRKHAARKTWEQIGKDLDRSPSGVSQHWRFMKQHMAAGSKMNRSHRKMRRRTSLSK